MKNSMKPNRITATKSMIRSNVVFPFKFIVEPKKDEWFLFGFEPNGYYGKQKFTVEIETESELNFEIGYKKNVNRIDIHNPSNKLDNIHIIESMIVKDKQNIDVEWNKTDLLNEYYLFIKVFNNGENNSLVSLKNVEWTNLG